MTQFAGRTRAEGVKSVATALAVVGAFLAAEARGTVQATGSMAAPRSQHTATFLGTGKVLFAGGTNAGGRLASAELFDPATGAFSPAAPMTAARSGHTATVLRNGKVLVVGGNGDSGAFASCLLFDPRTGTWTSTGSMATPRREHTATLLTSGQVLVAGGENGPTISPTPLAAAELYDPVTETWSAAASLGSARSGHAAALLEDGTVLVAGGQSDWLPDEYTSTAYRYYPKAGTWSATGSMATARRSFTLTVLPGGLVVAAGGESSSVHATAERYNVSNGTWLSAGSLGVARKGHAAALLPDARILLAGGRNDDGPIASMAEYDPASNSWSDVETGGTRYDHSATLLPGGRVLVAGGIDYTHWWSDADIVDRMNPAWTAAGTIGGTPPGREHGTATLLPNGKVLVLGGTPVGDATRGALFNPGSNTWAYTAGAMVYPRWKHEATLLADGRVLIVGGRRNDGTDLETPDDEIYDPVTDSFTVIPDSPRSASTALRAVLLSDGRVLVAGDESCFNYPGIGAVCSGWPQLFDPASGTWAQVASFPPTQDYGRTRGLTLLPNGRVLVVKYTNPGLFEPSTSSAFLFDPGAGDTWRRAGGPLVPGLVSGGTLLPGGDVLFVTDALELVLYDADTDRFRQPFPPVGIPGWGGGGSTTTLPDGRVLLSGGANEEETAAVPYVAVFDPSTGVTSALPSLSAARAKAATALLPDGRILVSGGRSHPSDSEGAPVTSAEVLDPWPTLAESWRPLVSAWPSSLTMPGAFTLSGTGFRGGAEASGGNGTLNSSADAPSVLLRRADGGLARWVPSSGAASWSSTNFPSATVSGLPGGLYRATVFASGLPSFSRAIPVTACELTTGVLETTPAASVCEGEDLSLSARQISGATYLWTRPDGSTSTLRSFTVFDAQTEDSGLYTVVATKNGCTSPPDTVLLRVAPGSEAPVLSAPSELGVNETARASVEFHPGSTYQWLLSSGTILSGQGTNELTFRAPSVGTSVTITVVETVGASCVQPQSQATITIVPCNLPTPTASNTGPYCTGATISLSTPTLSGATYSWTGPNGFTSNLQSPTLTNAWEGHTGTYAVTVTVADCTSAPATTDVVVYPPPVALAITAPASVAPGEHFEASVADAPGASWSWSVTNGTLLAGDGTPEVTVVAGNTGPVTVTVTETYAGAGCGGPREASMAIPVALPATRFHPVTPCRLFDTRESGGASAAAPALAAGETRTFTIGTRCGIDVATARTLSVNQTVALQAANGELVVYRGDLATPPVTSNISYRTGLTRANNGLLELSRAGDGTFKVHNRSTGSVEFILDVNGVFE